MAVDVPNTFTGGTRIIASDVNDNFSEIESKALDKTGDTMSGQLSMADNVVSRPELKDYAETVVAHGNMGATETFDCEGGNTHTGTLDSNVTFTLSNPPATGKLGTITMILTADGTSRTITWPGSVVWPGGVAPTMTATNGKRDIITLITTNAGTTWFGIVVGQNF